MATIERVEEPDEGGNLHAFVRVRLDDGRDVRLSPNATDAEIAIHVRDGAVRMDDPAVAAAVLDSYPDDHPVRGGR